MLLPEVVFISTRKLSFLKLLFIFFTLILFHKSKISLSILFLHLLLNVLLLFYHPFSLCKTFFLFGYYLLSNLVSLCVLGLSLVVVFGSLIVQHTLRNGLVLQSIISLFSSNQSSLVVKIITIALLHFFVLLPFLFFHGSIHLILMSNDCTPFVIDHFLLLNW